MPTVICAIPWAVASGLCKQGLPSIPWTTLLQHARSSMGFYVDEKDC